MSFARREVTGYGPPGSIRQRWPLLAGAFVVVAALCAVIAVLLSAPSPKTLQKAFAHLKADAAGRAENTPLALFGVLAGARDKTVRAMFTYAEDGGDALSGELALASRPSARELGLTADLSVYGAAVDFEAYFNSERIAARSAAADDNFYGFGYDALEDGLRVFGLDEAAVSSIERAVNAVRASLDGGAAMRARYGAAVSLFIKRLPVRAEDTEIYVAGQATPCQAFTYTVTTDALSALVEDFYMLARDDAMLPDAFLEEISAALAPFLGEGGGEVTLSFYVGRGNRLLHAALEAHAPSAPGAAVMASVTFGAKPDDEWVAEALIMDQNGKQGEFALCWSCSEDGGVYTDTVTLTSDLDGFPEYAAVTSEWTKSAGDFALRFEDARGAAALRGKLTCARDSFRLEFYGEETLSLVITAQPGAEVPEPAYIPPDASLPERLERAAAELFGEYYFKRPA
jgi:hypothetical protein